MRLLLALSFFLLIGCATTADVEDQQLQIDVQAEQIKNLQNLTLALERQPSYIEEVTTLSDLAERGCTNAVEVYGAQMVDRTKNMTRRKRGDALCRALHLDMIEGKQECAGVSSACSFTLCRDFSGPQSNCMGIQEPGVNFNPIRPPALINRGRVHKYGSYPGASTGSNNETWTKN